MTEKKYKLTDETITIHDRTLHRIQALKDFYNVKAGDLGGWIENEENLSHEGPCWVYDEAKVFDCAMVCDEAKVYGCARVYGEAVIFDCARVYGEAKVFYRARVYGDARVFGHAMVYGEARVFDRAMVYGEASIFGHAMVYGEAETFNRAMVYGAAKVSAYTILSGRTKVIVPIKSATDCLTMGPIGSRDDFVTFQRNSDVLYVATGCFKGPLPKFEKAVSETHGETLHAKQYRNAIEMAKKHFDILKED